MCSKTATPANVVIATVVDGVAQEFVSLADALKPDSRFATQVTPATILDEFSRFKLWAGNIAAHRKGRRSLEYRLRDANHLKLQTLSQLDALSRALQSALSIVKCEILPWEELSASDTDSDGDSSVGGLLGDTELRQLLGGIKIRITSLFRLSLAIRNPAPNSQSKSIISIDKAVYEEFDKQHVAEKFRDAPAYLVERLGRASTARRQYLSYREQHHEKFTKDIEKLGFEEATTEFTTNSTEATPIPRIERTRSLDVLDERDDTASQTSYATSSNTAIRVPTLPKAAHENDFFECPFWFLLVSIHTKIEWKQHVFRDLHPYCCTYEDCTIADRLYDSRKTWFAHELEVHRAEWQCIEECGHIYETESGFESHIRKDHPDLASPSMLSALKSTSIKSPSLRAHTKCILCGQAMTLRALNKHLGRHQQELALFALPASQDEEDDDDEHDDHGDGQEDKDSNAISKSAVEVSDEDSSDASESEQQYALSTGVLEGSIPPPSQHTHQSRQTTELDSEADAIGSLINNAEGQSRIHDTDAGPLPTVEEMFGEKTTGTAIPGEDFAVTLDPPHSSSHEDLTEPHIANLKPDLEKTIGTVASAEPEAVESGQRLDVPDRGRPSYKRDPTSHENYDAKDPDVIWRVERPSEEHRSRARSRSFVSIPKTPNVAGSAAESDQRLQAEDLSEEHQAPIVTQFDPPKYMDGGPISDGSFPNEGSSETHESNPNDRKAKAARRAAAREKIFQERYEAEQERKREKRNPNVYYPPPAAFDDSEEEYWSDEPVAPVFPEAPIPPRQSHQSRLQLTNAGIYIPERKDNLLPPSPPPRHNVSWITGEESQSWHRRTQEEVSLVDSEQIISSDTSGTHVDERKGISSVEKEGRRHRHSMADAPVKCDPRPVRRKGG